MPTLDPTSENEGFIGRSLMRFFASHDPVALLRMQGCHPVAVNEAHADHFGPVSIPVPGPVEFRNSVIKYEDQDGPIDCYCNTIRGIVAFTIQDCPFESAFANELDQQPGAPVAKLHLLRQERNGIGVRSYKPYRVFIRSVKPRPNYPLLEVRLVLLGSVTVLVSGELRGDGLPESLTAKLVLEHGDELLSEVLPVDPSEHDQYLVVSQTLSKIEKDPGNSRELFEEAIQLGKDRFQNCSFPYQLQGAADDLMRLSGDQWSAALKDLQASLWDAPIAGRYLKAKIEEWSQDETAIFHYQEQWPELPFLQVPVQLLESLSLTVARQELSQPVGDALTSLAFALSWMQGRTPGLPRRAIQSEPSALDETDQRLEALYDEVERLEERLTNSRADVALRQTIATKLGEIEVLEKEFLDEMERQFVANSLLKPGKGYAALEKAQAVLDGNQPTSTDNEPAI